MGCHHSVYSQSQSLLSLPSLPREECDGNAFGCVCPYVSGRVTQKLLFRLTCFLRKRWLGPPLKLSGSGSVSGLKNLFEDSSPLGGRNMPRRLTCAIMKTCVMTSHVRHSERGSVTSDCLVMCVRDTSLPGRLCLDIHDSFSGIHTESSHRD